MKYRPDIDGLRAVAVLPVVFYHLKTRYAPGGFVGVDVFFVISGFLITGLISGHISAGRYSIVDFYVRRARRIFPAMFVMFAISALFVCGFVMPSDVRAFTDSLTAASLFVSNIYFYLTADYFAPAAETQPLLHTWSLAVEEQFYIFFPLILLAVHRFAAGAEKVVLAVLALVSFTVSIWLGQADNSAAGFYLLHARAWELLLGTLLAIGVVPAIRSERAASALGALGLLLIAASVVLYGEETPFPGFAALAPCVGAALVIHSGGAGTTIVSRALSFGPVRFIGLISYSLYLWHWPIAVFSRYLAYWYGWNPEAKLHKFAVLTLSFALAALSWHIVERPFRQGAFRFGRGVTLGGSAVVMAMLVVMAGAMYPLSARLWPMPPDAQRMLTALQIDQKITMRLGTCFLNSTSEFAQFNQRDCLRMAGDKRNVLLLGDSQAADLWAGLSKVNPDINLLQATASGCKPLTKASGRRGCTDLMQFMLDKFIPGHRLDAIVLSGRWRPSDVDRLKATAEMLKSYSDKIIVLGPRTEYRSNLPWILAVSIVRRDPSMLNRLQIGQQKETDQALLTQLQGSGIEYFSLYKAICPGAPCRRVDEQGTPLAFDYGHFTVNGSVFVARKIRQSGVFEIAATAR